MKANTYFAEIADALAQKTKPFTLAEIAIALKAAATQYAPDPKGLRAYDDKAEFRFGTLVIRCAASREGVLSVAEKYAHPPRKLATLPPPPNLRRKPSWMNVSRGAHADEKLAALEAEFAPPIFTVNSRRESDESCTTA